MLAFGVLVTVTVGRVVGVLLGLSNAEEQEQAFAAAEDFQPLDARSLADIRARAEAAVRDKGRIWWDPPA